MDGWMDGWMDSYLGRMFLFFLTYQVRASRYSHKGDATPSHSPSLPPSHPLPPRLPPPFLATPLPLGVLHHVPSQVEQSRSRSPLASLDTHGPETYRELQLSLTGTDARKNVRIYVR